MIDRLFDGRRCFAFGPVCAQEIDWQQIDATLGRKPAVSGDVHRYGFPRTDLSVTLDGVAIKPTLALGGWVAFKPAHGGAMIMGDIVLLETEINPVMAKLIEGGLQITAVHNHLLRANPATFYMHVGGHGDPAKMAGVIRDALSAEQNAASSSPAAAAPPPAIDLNTAQSRPNHRRQRSTQRRTFINLACPVAITNRERDADCSCGTDGPQRQQSTSSRPAAARQRLPATLSWLEMR